MTLYGTIPITWVDWTHPVKGGMIKKDPKLEGGRKVKNVGAEGIIPLQGSPAFCARTPGRGHPSNC